MPRTGIEIQKVYNKTMDCADEARRIMRVYPLTTYLVTALVVIISSQPSTHARVHGADRAILERLRAFKIGLARAAALRRNLPHGLTMCSLLYFVITALITRGDAALNDHIAHLR
eukprot:2937435-Pleurochrysis_carterae.AAC.2